MASSKPGLVLDSGTGYIKIGWANETFPYSTYPSMVGRPILRAKSKYRDIDIKNIMIGSEAAKVRHLLDLSYPMETGIVKNWEDQCLVWQHGFDMMDIKPKETRILLTEPVKNPLKIREEMCEHIFEHFEFDKFQIQVQALLAMLGEGLMTSTVLDSGDGVTHIIPVIDGFIFHNLIKRINIAGKFITEQLTKLLFLKGYAFNTSADFETVREIKENCCMVSHDIEFDRKLARETTSHEMDYTLPDGTLIKIGRERFEAPEILFNPSIAGLEYPGIGEAIFNTIKEADATARGELFKNILLSGGTTMYPGFPTRVKIEMDKFYAKFTKKNPDDELRININVVDPPRRKYNVFIGGGFYLKLLDGRPDMWVTKQEYKEKGSARIMREKCGTKAM